MKKDRFMFSRIQKFVNTLSLNSEARKIIREEKKGWQYKLFACLLDEYFTSSHLNSTLKRAELHENFLYWFRTSGKKISKPIKNYVEIIKQEEQAYQGQLANVNNFEEIVRLAKAITDIHKELFLWLKTTKYTQFPVATDKAVKKLIASPSMVINSIKKFNSNLQEMKEKDWKEMYENKTNILSLIVSNWKKAICLEIIYNFGESEGEEVKFEFETFVLIRPKIMNNPNYRSKVKNDWKVSINHYLKHHYPNISLSETEGSGYIYLLTNPSMEGLVKIGKTNRNPRERAQELGSTTGVPTPFTLVFDVEVNDCAKAEEYAHAQLEQYRVSNRREFFEVPVNKAVKVLVKAEKLYG